MFRIDDASAATALPAPEAAGTEGYFTEGNPTAGTLATNVRGSWLNMIQEELRAIVVAGGLTPSKTTYNQVLSAIKRIGQNTIVLADTGAANAYTAVNATPLVAGTWIDGVVQAVKIAHANTGASTYAPDGLTAIPIYGLGLQALQGGELAVGGTAVLMHATIPGVNSGNPICVLMECAGGAQQIAAGTQSQHAVQFGQVSGVVGQSRNAKMSIATASASATFTADELIVESALGGLRYCLSSVNQTINIATTGAGGMASGSAPVNGFVAVYAQFNPTTGTKTLVGVDASSAPAAETFAFAGYSASALVAIMPTNGSGQFSAGSYLVGRSVSRVPIALVSSNSAQSSYTSLSFAAGAPRNARRLKLQFTTTNTAGSTTQTIYTASDSGGSGQQAFASPTVTASVGCTSNGVVDVVSTPTIFYKSDYTPVTGTPTFGIYLNGYEF